MFNFIHCTNIFGYSTTQLFTMLFPSQFFIYNYAKERWRTLSIFFFKEVKSDSHQKKHHASCLGSAYRLVSRRAHKHLSLPHRSNVCSCPALFLIRICASVWTRTVFTKPYKTMNVFNLILRSINQCLKWEVNHFLYHSPTPCEHGFCGSVITKRIC